MTTSHCLQTRKEVVVALYRARVEQYRRIFDPRRGGEHAALEQMERRLSWISRIGGCGEYQTLTMSSLKLGCRSIEEISANSLPESWTFAESFYLELIRETADHVRYLTRNVDGSLPQQLYVCEYGCSCMIKRRCSRRLRRSKRQ